MRTFSTPTLLLKLRSQLPTVPTLLPTAVHLPLVSLLTITHLVLARVTSLLLAPLKAMRTEMSIHENHFPVQGSACLSLAHSKHSFTVDLPS